MAMTIDLAGKVALVTGAGGGIGARIASRLAEAGADIAIHHFGRPEEAEAVAEQCRAQGHQAVTSLADFAADPSSAAAIVDDAVARLGRIDILVNNAAVTTRREPFVTHSRALFEQIMAVGVTAAFLGTQTAAQHMIAQGIGGRVINIGSVHARSSAPQRTAYEVSKGALHAFTFSAAVQLGQYGITVNCVAPGAIGVAHNADVFDAAWYVSRTPVGRLGTTDDIAALVVFLASDEASFISGETIFADGGMTRRMALIK